MAALTASMVAQSTCVIVAFVGHVFVVCSAVFTLMSEVVATETRPINTCKKNPKAEKNDSAKAIN